MKWQFIELVQLGFFGMMLEHASNARRVDFFGHIVEAV